MAKQTKHSRVIKGLRNANGGAWAPTMKFFDYGAKQGATPRETDIDALRSALGVSRRDMVELVNGIIDVGIGVRIVGRRGHNSRIRWLFSLSSISKVARGDADELEEVGARSSGGGLVVHKFKLRDGRPPVTMRLFDDLTEREVERLYLFQKSLVK
jgi:hypothetical protein